MIAKYSAAEVLVEEAIQIAGRLQAATDALAQARNELSDLCTQLGDTVVPTEQEVAKRDAIDVYRTTIAQVDSGLAALNGRASDEAAGIAAERRRVIETIDTITIGNIFPREYRTAFESIIKVLRDEVSSGRAVGEEAS